MTILNSNKKYLAITMVKIAAACFLGAFSFYKFTLEAGLIPGGFSGIGAVIELATGGGYVFGMRILTAGIIGIVLNIPFYLVSYKGMNKRFFWFSVYGMTMFSVMLEVVARTMPKGVMDIEFQNQTLAPLLYSLVAGVASGIAGGYILRLGYSTGGSELVATLINKRFAFIKIGTVINAIKIFVIILYAVFIGTTADMIVLTIMSGFVSSAVVDILVDGFKAAKAYYIISHNPSELSAAILRHLKRSSTLFSGEGQLLHTEQKMLMCIIYNHEVARLRAIVHSVDKKAFMFSTVVKEAYGTGFAEQKPPVKLFRTTTRSAADGEAPQTRAMSENTIEREAKNIAREIMLRSTSLPEPVPVSASDNPPDPEIASPDTVLTPPEN